MTVGRREGAATIADVAAAAGVSRAAVSKVLRNAYGVSPEMRARVARAMADLDYRPRVAARAMRGASSTIGVMLPLYRTSFFDDVLAGVTGHLASSSLQVILAPVDVSHRGGYRALEALADRQVDGIIALSPLTEPRWLEQLARRIPLVELGRHDQSLRYDTVVGDDVKGARLVMEHLSARGHTKISHITHADPQEPHLKKTPPAIRCATYREYMAGTGAGDHIEVISALFDDRSAEAALNSALDAGSAPTAIFAGNDEAALGALRALHQHGLGAGEVAVCGYDNSRIASHPLIGLTSVDQRGLEMGSACIRLLLERIAGRTTPRHEIIDTELVVRASSG